MSDAGEIIKSGAFDKLADIMHRLAGPLAEEVGQIMGDKAKVYALKNWITVLKETQKLLAEAHLPANAVPPRLFLPILQAASIESDETLQGLWAGLLATASEKSDLLSPSFIETLKQLTPIEAKMLNRLFDVAEIQPNFRLGNVFFLMDVLKLEQDELRLPADTFERLGLMRREYNLKERSGELPSDLVVYGSSMGLLTPSELPELTYEFGFTAYGVRFMNVCRGPMRNTSVKVSI